MAYRYKPYEGYQPYDWMKAAKLEAYHDSYWKAESRRKKKRPLCGAKCRNGQPCKAKAVVDPKTDRPINGRCRMHGGLSTGPKTLEGKAQSREAARRAMKEFWRVEKSSF